MIVLLPDTPIARAVAGLEVLSQEGFNEVSLPINGDLEPADIRKFFGARLRVGVHDVYQPDRVATAIELEPEFVLAGFVDATQLRAAGIKTFLSALTPTEIKAAAERADGVLVEPAGHLGDGYPAALRTMMGEFPLVARGMTDSYGIKPWIKAGFDVCVDAPIGDAFAGGDMSSFRMRLRNHATAAREAGLNNF